MEMLTFPPMGLCLLFIPLVDFGERDGVAGISVVAFVKRLGNHATAMAISTSGCSLSQTQLCLNHIPLLISVDIFENE